eukprot:969439-Lingulodinium_polyedra.AAC.1
MCYSHSSSDVHLVGWIGNDAGSVVPRVYIDADFAGCLFAECSISGVFTTVLRQQRVLSHHSSQQAAG